MCHREADEKEKESARDTGDGPFPSSHRPPRTFYNSITELVFLLGYPAGASAEERGRIKCLPLQIRRNGSNKIENNVNFKFILKFF